MGNLYGSGRSNYFAVRDEAHFLKWAEALGVEVNENSDTHTIGKTFAMIALNDDGGFPDAYASGEFDAEDADEETAEVVERDILMELSYMLHPQTPFVWMQTAEKLQYLVGVAFAVAPADETNPYAERSHLRTVSIDRIYDLCKEICQYEPTKCEY